MQSKYWGTLKTAFFANLMIKSVAKKMNMVSVAIINQSYNFSLYSPPVYMAHLEEEFILKSSQSFNPTMYRRYVDDIFCLFRKREHATKFLAFINSINPVIQFEMEDEVDDRLSFLDTVIKRSSNNPYPEINTRIKPTDKGLFYNFSSFIPDSYKRNLVYCLVYRVYRIASSDTIFKDNLRLSRRSS